MNILTKASLVFLSGALLNSAPATSVAPAGGYQRNLVRIDHGRGQPTFAYIPVSPTTIALHIRRGLKSGVGMERRYYDWGPVRIEKPGDAVAWSR